MKKFLLLTIFSGLLFLNGCVKNISNVDIQTLNQKASEYMEKGEYDKAIARLESILDLNADFPETHYNLGIAYYQSNDYEKALASLNEAISRKEKFADAYYSRAVVYEDWAYSLIEGESIEQGKLKAEATKEDKELSIEYLKKAKEDFEKYLELKKDAKDKDDVHEKIIQIENKLNLNSDIEG